MSLISPLRKDAATLAPEKESSASDSTVNNPDNNQGAVNRAGRVAPRADSRVRLSRSHPVIQYFKTASWFIAAWVVLGLIWEAAVYLEAVSARILPPPSETLPYWLSGPSPAGIGGDQTTYGGAITNTLARIGVGFLLGLSVAAVCGIAITLLRPVRNLLTPIVQTIAPISPVAWIPFAIAIVGIGSPAAIFVVFMTIFGSMTISLVTAIDSTPREYLMVAKNLGTRGSRLWTHVILPSAAPSLVETARLSFFAAWMAVLAGEMAGIQSGLGYLIMLGQQMNNMNLVMVGIMTIGLLGFVIDRALVLVKRQIAWWGEQT